MTTAKARRLQNLRRRPPAPAKGRGRIQRQVRRAFEACGPRLSVSLVYDWARRWQRRHDEKRINQRERYSIVRVLMTMAVRDGRAGTRGRPWLWRRIEDIDFTLFYLFESCFQKREGEMAVYGYARVSTRDQDLAGQVAEL